MNTRVDTQPQAANIRPGALHRVRSESLDVVRSIGRLRLPEFILFFGLIFEEALFGLPFPFSQVVVIAIVGLALFRRPRYHLGSYQTLVPVLALALFYVGVVSLFADPTEDAADWHRRLLRLTITAMLVLTLATGRIDLRSGLVGLGTGLVFNAAAFYAGIAPDRYGGVLSGFLIDKNVAGLNYAVFGILMLLVTKRRALRLVLVLGFGVLVWLTDSRTSLSAFAFAVIWIFLAPHLPIIGRWILGGLIYFGVQTLSEDFAQVGRFSDREGSDLLRSRIDAASELKVEEAGFFGQGLGEAYIIFADDVSTWYFHNSYWSALVEGGWPWLLVLVGITVGVGLRPFTQKLSDGEVICQAATIALLICSWRLGEVFFTATWAIAMACAIYAVISQRAMHQDKQPTMDVYRGGESHE